MLSSGNGPGQLSQMFFCNIRKLNYVIDVNLPLTSVCLSVFTIKVSQISLFGNYLNQTVTYNNIIINIVIKILKYNHSLLLLFVGGFIIKFKKKNFCFQNFFYMYLSFLKQNDFSMLQHVVHIDLSKNQLIELPQNFGDLKKLQVNRNILKLYTCNLFNYIKYFQLFKPFFVHLFNLPQNK